MKFLVILFALGLANLSAHGQANGVPQVPCAYSGNLVRNRAGDVIRYTSKEMKAKALFKRDLSDFFKRMDFQETTVVDLLVGPDGSVVCTKTMLGIPAFGPNIEEALKAWKFRPIKSRGMAVGYIGRLEFRLCNMLCGPEGNSMTLLK